jgi:hypothetical protein
VYFTFSRSSTQPELNAMPTLHCKQMTYQGIDRVSRESCRGIDHSGLLRHNTAVAGRKPAANANQENI